MENGKFYTDEEKQKRICEEVKKLEKLFSGMDLKTKKAVHSLISNAAFMTVALEELQEEIKRSGYIEDYQNGANQSGVKKSSAVEVYNLLVKNHMGIMKQLTDLLPKPKPKEGENEGDGFQEFVNKKNK